MNKAQTMILQFILFFMIGFAVFLAVGNLFRMQSDIFREDVASWGVKLTNTYISSAIITATSTCKQCGFSNLTLAIPPTSGGYYQKIDLADNGMNVSTINKQSVSSIHNMNSSLTLDGTAFSVKAITLTYDKTKNKLEVS